MSSGAFIDDEWELYNIKEIFLLLFYSVICIMGIFLIARKELMPFIENKVIFGAKHNQEELLRDSVSKLTQKNEQIKKVIESFDAKYRIKNK
jgi:hypothetical protein